MLLQEKKTCVKKEKLASHYIKKIFSGHQNYVFFEQEFFYVCKNQYLVARKKILCKENVI